MARTNGNLPKWLKRERDIYYVDPNVAYPAIFDALGIKQGEVDQYWAETAYQIAKLETQRIAGDNGGKPIEIRIQADGDRKKKWGLAGLKKGRGADAATKGMEARAHFERVSGRF